MLYSNLFCEVTSCGLGDKEEKGQVIYGLRILDRLTGAVLFMADSLSDDRARVKALSEALMSEGADGIHFEDIIEDFLT